MRAAYALTPALREEIPALAHKQHISAFWIWDVFMETYVEKFPHGFLFWIIVGLWGVLCVVAALIFIVILKWLVICRVRKGDHPAASYRVITSGFYLALQTAASPVLNLTMGTPVLAMYLRLLGARVGRRAFINTIMAGEPDLLSIGSEVCINRMALLGGHTYEDWVMKFGRITLDDRTALGCEAAVFRGAKLQQRVVLEDSTLCLADEELQTGRYRG
eukprot:CAMPEP_0175483088 /NCGR_PEP_ID=MMETSP0095-20121207/79309_1 /TAXON_ID=311494 /ORGANISM="Alexandrium monilatum, Strain CCMP3105" /LENGTH=217 /DNA_ID=CAMNT_0016784789 /DNA_START=72 /DNA_END=722 /DNA_ORIENTATION=-